MSSAFRVLCLYCSNISNAGILLLTNYFSVVVVVCLLITKYYLVELNYLSKRQCTIVHAVHGWSACSESTRLYFFLYLVQMLSALVADMPGFI